jgi:hypothetical protein
MIFNNFRNRPVIFLSELLNECMEKLYRAHLLSSDYNHNVYATAPALTNSFHELGNKASRGNHRHSSRIAFVNSVRLPMTAGPCPGRGVRGANASQV